MSQPLAAGMPPSNPHGWVYGVLTKWNTPALPFSEQYWGLEAVFSPAKPTIHALAQLDAVDVTVQTHVAIAAA